MNVTYLALLILLVIYIPIYFYVRKSEWAKAKGIVPYGPLIMIKTRWGIKLMDRVGKYKRVWRVMGFISKVISLILMIYIVAILVIDLIMLPSMINNGGMGIEYALAIPGINPMLPLVYGWIGLIIAMVVHEFAHGVQTRANDMDVDSTGILYGVVPLGAFVEPNEEQVNKCSRRARMDLYAAGITTNFIVAMVLFIVMCASLTGGITSTYGDSPAISGVTTGSPGLEYGVPSTAVITYIDGTPVNNMDEFHDVIDHYGQYTLTYDYRDDKGVEVTMPMGTYIESVVSGSPADEAMIKKGAFIESITLDGVTTNIGSAVTFSNYMRSTDPNDVVTISIVRIDEGEEYRTSYIVKLGEKNGVGYLGLTTTTSGFGFTTPNTVISESINPFYGCTTIADYASGAISYVGSAFVGYSPIPEGTHWWFESNFMPNDVFWVFMSLVYWTFWLNLVLGISNALPAIPFDGGFLYMGGVDFILQKFGVKDDKREKYVDIITSATSYFMLAVLILVLLVIII